ncbi:MAG: condensation domain-containing protein [Verrucomicrobiota bacterium]|nr:condensation domain-containing protein [Verrucomicrobiota bacterium]
MRLSNRFSAEEWSGRLPAYSSGGPLRIPSAAPITLTEALLRTASCSHRGVTYLNAQGESEFQSYAKLLKEAKQILQGLRNQGLKPRDRVILQIDNLRKHFTTFWACVLGGITPVTVAVAPSYKEANGVVNKLFNTWKLLKKPLVISSESLVAQIEGIKDFLPAEELSVIPIEVLEGGIPAEDIYSSHPSDLVFFQLTSGSTGTPKCIQETHHGIINHIHGAQQFNSYTADDITLNWLPVDHVVPILTSHLKDVYLGCSQVHAKTEFVLNEPLRWLDLIEQFRVTHTWSPNFGFKLVTDRLKAEPGKKWNLSSLKYMMNAGEQVTLQVVSDFLAATEPFGVRQQVMQPAFGMAEVCTCMTYQNQFNTRTGFHRFLKSSLTGLLKPGASEDGTVTFIDLGPPVPGVEIRITDSNNEVVPEGVVGRFQIRGNVVTPGYLYNDAANQEAFVGDGWFNSGDLGFILNGRLTLTGREKEMIIVRGANFYCYEIEDVVNGMEGVEPTFVGSCAVSDAASGSEGLAIFFVPKSTVREGAAINEKVITLINEIKRRVGASLGINPAFVIPLEKKNFPKTTSGKIQRGQMKKGFEAGDYSDLIEALKQASTAPRGEVSNEIESKLMQIWQEVLRTKEIGTQDNFFVLGGNSLLATQIVSRVRDAFNVRLELGALFEKDGSIEGLAKIIASSSSESQASRIPIVIRNGPLPLTDGQRRLWLLEQMNPGSAAYHVATPIRLKGAIKREAVDRAINSIVDRHEMLRTVFQAREGMVMQQVRPAMPISLNYHDLSRLSDSDREAAALELTSNESFRPFDLARGPLIRGALIRFSEKDHILFITMHQIVTDGWSLGIFYREFSEFYQAAVMQEVPDLPQLRIQYGDYASWQKQRLTPAMISSHLEHWERELDGVSGRLDLPLDLPRPDAPTFSGNTQMQLLTRELTKQLKDFSSGQGNTLFMTLLGVYQLLLRKLSGQQDIVVGSALAGRTETDIESLIGFFVNTVGLRCNFNQVKTFNDVVNRAHQALMGAYAHQEAPFEEVIREVLPQWDRSRTPLFQAWFSFWDPMPKLRAGELLIEPLKILTPAAQFEISLFVIDEGEQIRIFWEYNTDLFKASTISNWMEQFAELLGKAIQSSNQPLISILNEIHFSRAGSDQIESAPNGTLKQARRRAAKSLQP